MKKSLFFVFIIFFTFISFSAGWYDLGEAGFYGEYSQYHSTAVDSKGTVYVAFQNSAYRTTVMKFDGSGWVNVGNPAVSESNAEYINIVFDSSDTPYVAFSDLNWGDMSRKLSVMKFDGTNWSYVGTRQFTAGDAGFVKLVIDKVDDLWVAFKDSSQTEKATVMKFDGTTWNVVGSAGFSAGAAYYIGFDVSVSGIPYLGYVKYDAPDQYKPFVMKFDGVSWATIGDFGPIGADNFSLKTTSDDLPVIAYRHWGLDGVQVKKYNEIGDIWEDMGTNTLTIGSIAATSLFINDDDIPFVAFSEHSEYKASVIRLSGSQWRLVGDANLSSGATKYLALTGDSNGNLFLGYQDDAYSDGTTVKVYGEFKSLIAVETEAAGSNCADGGIKVTAGFDINSNDVLDSSEVTETTYVCNGADGADGADGTNGADGADGADGENGYNILIRTTTGTFEANCLNGGVMIEAGLDLNRNGILDSAEVDPALTTYVCNGADGADGANGADGADGTNGVDGADGEDGEDGKSALVKTSEEPAGDNCENGGTKIEAGIDSNGNGLLDVEEIDADLTRYVCDGTDGADGIDGADGENGTDGSDGDDGTDGADGATGEKGENGETGYSSMVSVTDEPSGDNCEDGGKKIETGLDLDRNGELDEGEIDPDNTYYVCNGVDAKEASIGSSSDGCSMTALSGDSSLLTSVFAFLIMFFGLFTKKKLFNF